MPEFQTDAMNLRPLHPYKNEYILRWLLATASNTTGCGESKINHKN